MRRVGGHQQSRIQKGMIIRRCGWLICNTKQTQARYPSNFLQSRSRLSHREEEGVDAMLKIPTIEIEARNAISSDHCREERNQSPNQRSITG
ncbi:hypothetical protein AMTRI_Chr03g50310 [Amborella trichopoda]